MLPVWRLIPLTDMTQTRRALWLSEDYPMFVLWHQVVGSTRGATKPFSMHHAWQQDVLGVVGTLVTRLSAQARGGTRGVLWLSATAVYRRLSRRSNLNNRYRPKGHARAMARLRQETGVGDSREWDSYAQKLKRSPTGDDK